MLLKKILKTLLPIIFIQCQTVFAGGLEIYPENTNYLMYNNKPTILIGASASNHDFHVMDFDTTFLSDMQSYGANSTWFMLENFYNTAWNRVVNTPESFYDKIELICKTAYEKDIMIGICFYGYGLVRYPFVYSFNAACDCKGDPGPLINPYDFYNIKSTDPDVVEARTVQLKIIDKVLEHTWNYPNVYYNPAWEVRVIWNTQVAEWYPYISNYIRKQGAKINPDIKHLICIEKTMTQAQTNTYGADFVIDEDGNATKTLNVPFVYWSMDGIYRNSAVWNGDLEPTKNWEYMRQELINGAAGISSIWDVDSDEDTYLATIASFTKTIDNFNNEPGDEITDINLPLIPNGNFIDKPDSVIVNQSNNNVGVFTSNEYLKTTEKNAIAYSDRSFLLKNIPSNSGNWIRILTNNSDKRNSSVNNEYSFVLLDNIKQKFDSVNVYIGYDRRILSGFKPNWLSDFNKTTLTITDDQNIIYDLYRKKHTVAGNTITFSFGKNLETDTNLSCSMYLIFNDVFTSDVVPDTSGVEHIKPQMIKYIGIK